VTFQDVLQQLPVELVILDDENTLRIIGHVKIPGDIDDCCQPPERGRSDENGRILLGFILFVADGCSTSRFCREHIGNSKYVTKIDS
jgi:hypothetical protein